ncbi:MAG: dTDP-glucose 4,6-dehydratase [Phascolarctobacterium sp.]|nr:dTDP-glucose 4,6-dehydratase [Phascolarctobacterium sp.]
MKKTYLITGGAGFIGSNFIRYMLKTYKNTLLVTLEKLTSAGNLGNLKNIKDDDLHIFVQGDICDNKFLASLFRQYDFDYVINFAAETNVVRSIAEPIVFVQTNVVGTLSLLMQAKAAWYNSEIKIWQDGKKYIQIFTDEVYGVPEGEDAFTEDMPFVPHNPYSSSKASADGFVKAFYDTYDMPINITRCSNNYGTYQFPEKLIPLIINNAVQHRPLPVYGDGLQVRDWLYVEDHCRAIDMVAYKWETGEVYNIGGSNKCHNISVIRAIIDKMHTKFQDDSINESLINYVGDRLGQDRRYAIDSAKIENELGWYPEITFEKWIAITVDWYLENLKWLNDASHRKLT